MRKQTKTTLRKKCDILFSKIVRVKGKCEYCGKSEQSAQMHCAHIISRSCLKLRYELKNAFCLCSYHHRYFHQYPLKFAEFVKEKKGQDTYDWLITQSNTLSPLPIEWFIEMLKKLTKKYDD